MAESHKHGLGGGAHSAHSVAPLAHLDKKRKSMEVPATSEVTSYTLKEVGPARSIEHRVFFHQGGASRALVCLGCLKYSHHLRLPG